MESGRSGASGQCVVRSVRGSDGGSATRHRPVTEARCVREKVKALRTAREGCVRKVSMCKCTVISSMKTASSSSHVGHAVSHLVLDTKLKCVICVFWEL